jgi:hypothetical protein
MMNMIELQDKLKNFSQEQLVGMMQQPSGEAPQFMVLGEITRRQKMQQEATKAPTQSVAQEAVSAAGVPQGGIADMARTLAPQTNVAQNTGAMSAPPQGIAKMASGGVIKMAGGSTIDRLELNPKVIAGAARNNMTPKEYVASLSPSVKKALLSDIRQSAEGIDTLEADSVPGQQFARALQIQGYGDAVKSFMLEAGKDGLRQADAVFAKAMSEGSSLAAATAAAASVVSSFVGAPELGAYLDNVSAELLAKSDDFVSTRTGERMPFGYEAPAFFYETPEQRAEKEAQARQAEAARIAGKATEDVTSVEGPDGYLPASIIQSRRMPTPSGVSADFQMDLMSPSLGNPRNIPSQNDQVSLPSSEDSPQPSMVPAGLSPADRTDRMRLEQNPATMMFAPDGSVIRNQGDLVDPIAEMERAVFEERKANALEDNAGPDYVRPTSADYATSLPPPAVNDARISRGYEVDEPGLWNAWKREADSTFTMRNARDAITATGDAVIDFGGDYLDRLKEKPLQNLLGKTAGDYAQSWLDPEFAAQKAEEAVMEQSLTPVATPKGLMEIKQAQTTREKNNAAEVEAKNTAAKLLGGTTTGSGSGGSGSGGSSNYETKLLEMLSRQEANAKSDKWMALAQAGMSLMQGGTGSFGGDLGKAGQTGLAALQGSRDSNDKSQLGILSAIEASKLKREAIAASGAKSGMVPAGVANSLRGQISDLMTQKENLAGVPGAELELAQLDERIRQQMRILDQINAQMLGQYGISNSGGNAPAGMFTTSAAKAAASP